MSKPYPWRQQLVVRRLFHIALSVIALSAIIVGAAFAYDRETVHNADLPELYREMNRNDFQNKLPYAQLRWTEISHRYGQTTVFDDGTALIEIDRRVVQTHDELMKTLRHEGCRALTYPEAKSTPAGRVIQSLRSTNPGEQSVTMPKAKARIRVLPISPITLRCPFCKAEPDHDCETSLGGFSVVHVQRIQKAAAFDVANASRAKKRSR